MPLGISRYFLLEDVWAPIGNLRWSRQPGKHNGNTTHRICSYKTSETQRVKMSRICFSITSLSKSALALLSRQMPWQCLVVKQNALALLNCQKCDAERCKAKRSKAEQVKHVNTNVFALLSCQSFLLTLLSCQTIALALLSCQHNGFGIA